MVSHNCIQNSIFKSYKYKFINLVMLIIFFLYILTKTILTMKDMYYYHENQKNEIIMD
jgi:hypothetical protein